MARHVINIPKGADGPQGGGYDIVWDDEAGTVESEDLWNAGLAAKNHGEWTEGRGPPLDLTRDGRILVLNDPLHDSRDFWHLLPWKMREEPLRSTLPPILRDVEPTPVTPMKPPTIVVDGVRRPAIEGVEFVW